MHVFRVDACVDKSENVVLPVLAVDGSQLRIQHKPKTVPKTYHYHRQKLAESKRHRQVGIKARHGHLVLNPMPSKCATYL